MRLWPRFDARRSAISDAVSCGGGGPRCDGGWHGRDAGAAVALRPGERRWPSRGTACAASSASGSCSHTSASSWRQDPRHGGDEKRERACRGHDAARANDAPGCDGLGHDAPRDATNGRRSPSDAWAASRASAERVAAAAAHRLRPAEASSLPRAASDSPSAAALPRGRQATPRPASRKIRSILDRSSLPPAAACKPLLPRV